MNFNAKGKIDSSQCIAEADCHPSTIVRFGEIRIGVSKCRLMPGMGRERRSNQLLILKQQRRLRAQPAHSLFWIEWAALRWLVGPQHAYCFLKTNKKPNPTLNRQDHMSCPRK